MLSFLLKKNPKNDEQKDQNNKISDKKDRFFKSELPLIEAVRHQKTKEVHQLLTSTKNINERNSWGDTALTVASYIGNTYLVNLLILKGATVDSDAVNAAIQAGNLDVVQILLSKGGNVNTPDSSGITPLRKALSYVSYSPFQTKYEHDWHVRIEIIDEVLKKDIKWNEHYHDRQTIFEFTESTKNQLISNFPDHPNRGGFVRICREIMAQEQALASRIGLTKSKS